jgi:ATP-dependent Clp protease protease subunit
MYMMTNMINPQYDDAPHHQEPPIRTGTYDQLSNRRILWLGVEVNDDICNDLAAKMLLLGQMNNDPIWLFINSPGGSVTAGFALYSMMQAVSAPVYTIGVGLCASMGQFLLSSGDPGHRFIFEDTRVLMHQPSGGVGGTQTDVRIDADLILDMKQRLGELTAQQTGHTLKKIYKDNEYDHWYSAVESRNYGFVDHVVTTIADINTIIEEEHAEK